LPGELGSDQVFEFLQAVVPGVLGRERGSTYLRAGATGRELGESLPELRDVTCHMQEARLGELDKAWNWCSYNAFARGQVFEEFERKYPASKLIVAIRDHARINSTQICR
jgi:hypothetical protein